MNLVWLSDPRSLDASSVGGKATNLSRLAAAGYRVPDGFCIPASDTSQPQPRAFRAEIAEAIGELTARSQLTELAVAVRSSAVDEDGAAASFAGQHETFLNVMGTDAILDAVAKCLQSASSERALEYRRQQGLSAESVRLAVLVQRLVYADVSAVVFSANPVTGECDEVVINASWGLGESIVGGTVTPDSFVVRKSDLTVTQTQIAAKARMTIPVPGGTREVETPSFLRELPSLNEAQIIETARLAVSLEATMGFGVDVECAWAAGQLYVLQCRPITTNTL